MTQPAVVELQRAADALRAEQVKEWSQYEAIDEIFILGVRAANPGDPIPAGHVTSGLVHPSQVRRLNTKAEASALAKEV